MTQRLDPVTQEEWAKLRAALPSVLDAKSFLAPVNRLDAEAKVTAALDVFWATGCHPVVLADPKAHSVTIRGQPGQLVMSWRRPKKKGIAGYCAMPLTDAEADALKPYLETGLGSRKTLWAYVRDCAKVAGVKGVTPRTIRHTVGWRVFKALGPTAAKESLNVSDRVLQYYLSMESGTRIQAIRELMGAAKTPTLQKTVEIPKGEPQ